MLAAFIGFKLHGGAGASIAAGAIFLPSFLMMLTILPLLKRMGNLGWLRAFMRGVGPAVSASMVIVSALVLCRWRLPPLPLILGAALLGIVVQDMR